MCLSNVCFLTFLNLLNALKKETKYFEHLRQQLISISLYLSFHHITSWVCIVVLLLALMNTLDKSLDHHMTHRHVQTKYLQHWRNLFFHIYMEPIEQ